MEEKVFVYGTLSDPKIQVKLLGRAVKTYPDILVGYEMSTIEINQNMYSIVIEKLNGPQISGKVIIVEEEDLNKIDEYETDAYRRKKVTLKSGMMAWIYQK